ncbi:MULTISPECIES: putative holin-like toxin [Lacticaseibacillus]|nr:MULTISPECIES: putative holin-like toxin [Lacticaseibacillus]QVI32440.1 holin [Lacticaseibacillus zeae]
MSDVDAISLMLTFGSFVLLLIGTVVAIVVAIIGNQKDRH